MKINSQMLIWLYKQGKKIYFSQTSSRRIMGSLSTRSETFISSIFTLASMRIVDVGCGAGGNNERAIIRDRTIKLRIAAMKLKRRYKRPAECSDDIGGDFNDMGCRIYAASVFFENVTCLFVADENADRIEYFNGSVMNFRYLV